VAHVSIDFTLDVVNYEFVQCGHTECCITIKGQNDTIEIIIDKYNWDRLKDWLKDKDIV
jgi:hypothetical protein